MHVISRKLLRRFWEQHLDSEHEYALTVERLNRLLDEVGTDEQHPLFTLLDTLGTLIPGTVDLLYRVHANGHSLFCMSNMQAASMAYLEQTYAFWEVFAGRIISCQVQLIKPEPAIYAYLLETYGLEGSQTVFIDDTAVNLEAAAQFGIQTIKFENPGQCERQLQALGCI